MRTSLGTQILLIRSVLVVEIWMSLSSRSWVDSLIINISALGIKFGISDVTLVGSMALLILSIVCLYCTRRENHAVGYLLIDSQKVQRDLREAVYHAVASHLVFLPVGDSDSPIDRLEDPRSKGQKSIFRIAFDILIVFPGIACFVIFFVETKTLFMPAPLREGHPVLWHILGHSSKMQVYEMLGACFVIGIATTWACYRSREYSTATVLVVRAFGEKLAQG